MKILFHEYGDTPSKRGVRLYLEDGTELPNLVSYSIEPRERGNRLYLRLEMIDVEPVYVDAPPAEGSAAPDSPELSSQSLGYFPLVGFPRTCKCPGCGCEFLPGVPVDVARRVL